MRLPSLMTAVALLTLTLAACGSDPSADPAERHKQSVERTRRTIERAIPENGSAFIQAAAVSKDVRCSQAGKLHRGHVVFDCKGKNSRRSMIELSAALDF